MAKKKHSNPAPVEAPAAEPVQDLYYPTMPLELIDPAADNPRKHLGDLTELAQSMAGPAGVVQPLLLTPRGDRFLTVCGHRRRAAAELAHLPTVPALVREMDEHTRKTVMLVENLQRSDLTPLEEAQTFQELVDLGHSQRQIAADVGRSQSHIAKRLSLLELPETVRAQIDSGGITVSDGLELQKLKDRPELLEKVIEGNPHVSIAGRVERALEEVKDAELQAERVRELEATGLRVLVCAHRWHFTPPKGAICIGTQWDSLPVDPEAHAAEPCHAVGITLDAESEPIPLCTDRSRHPEVRTHREESESLADSRKAQDAARRRKLEEEAAAKARRRAFILDLAKRKPVKRDECIAFVCRNVIRTEAELQFDNVEDVAEHLGIWKRDDAGDGLEPDEALQRYVDSAKTDVALQVMVVLSLMSDLGETEVLKYLAAQGYELTAAEQERLAQETADEAAA